ncbi:MAG: hypothetical protein FDX02_06705 [Chlorobium sp.]|nr:MAG: hypothetical protein FDX02_06705 [Chlorobium sp.]
MRDLVIKIKKALQSIEEEKGEFKIKCLVATDPSNMLWDLILSAEWFQGGSERAEYGANLCNRAIESRRFDTAFGLLSDREVMVQGN